MSHDEWEIPRFSKAAITVLGKLHAHGWSMRIVPLFRHCALDRETFTTALAELIERRWVKVVARRRPRAVPPPGEPERCGRIDRIVASRFGRWRYLATWPNPW